MSTGGAPPKGGGPLKLLKMLDAYPKVNEDFFTKTMAGGVITMISSVVMVLLFISELSECPFAARLCLQLFSFGVEERSGCTLSMIGLYLRVNTLHELSVDTSRGETIKIHVRPQVHKMPEFANLP